MFVRTTPSAIMPMTDYSFVEGEPPDEFICPVTRDLMLKPHLTSCCGGLLSEEAVTRIQEEGKPCPLCKGSHWSTMFDKRFLRKVNLLRVFCWNENRGCGWQGELASFQKHVQTCPMKHDPLMTELQPLYVLHILNISMFYCKFVFNTGQILVETIDIR